MERRVFVDDGSAAIGGAIVDDDPLGGANGLREHALDGEAEVSLFVANWGNDYVFVGEGAHSVFTGKNQVEELSDREGIKVQENRVFSCEPRCLIGAGALERNGENEA